MYKPKHFDSKWPSVKRLINENGFSTIISYPKNEMPFINHLPLILEKDAGANSTLVGHMAMRNPQWRHFEENSLCTIIIHGPHTYITPRWYRSGRDVPTWNYAVAHLQGQIELLKNFDEQISILKQLTEFFESSSATPWEFDLPDDLQDPQALTSAIISFRFEIKSFDAKFKLSQNRPQEDLDGIREGLNERTDDDSRAIQALMKQP